MDDSELYERSPFLVKLKARRLAPSRLADLLSAARNSQPPAEPEPWECCGSSCKPCVKELWREELRCWKEVHPDGAEEEERAGDGEGDEGSNAKVTEVEERRKEEELQKFKEERRLEREQRNSPKVEIAVEEKLAALSLSNAFRGLKQKLSGPDAW